MKRNISPFFILFAAIFWGTTGTAQALAPDSAHPIAIGTARLVVGGFFLLFIVLLLGKFQVKNLPVKLTLGASFCMALYQPLFFSAVSITGVAIGTVVAIGSAPILAGLLEWFLLKARPTNTWFYSTSLAIIGCFMLFINKESVVIDPFGIILALGAGLSFASYTLISKELVKHHSSLSVVAIVFTLSAIILSPSLFFYDMSWITSFRGIAVSFHLGVIATGVAYFLFANGLSNTTTSTAVTLSLAEPLTATILGVFLLGEYFNVTSWLGICLLLLGLWFLINSPGTSKKNEHIIV